MKIKQNGLIVFLSILIAVFAVSCADEWDEHYNATAPDKLDKNLYEYLKTQENLSVFTNMLELTGYDSIINEAQTFTVWVPDNEALKDYVPSLLMIAVDPEFGEDIKGVKFEESEKEDIKVSRLKITSDKASAKLGKEKGTYVGKELA